MGKGRGRRLEVLTKRLRAQLNKNQARLQNCEESKDSARRITISGIHGSGKTTLKSKLLVMSNEGYQVFGLDEKEGDPFSEERIRNKEKEDVNLRATILAKIAGRGYHLSENSEAYTKKRTLINTGCLLDTLVHYFADIEKDIIISEGLVKDIISNPTLYNMHDLLSHFIDVSKGLYLIPHLIILLNVEPDTAYTRQAERYGKTERQIPRTGSREHLRIGSILYPQLIRAMPTTVRMLDTNSLGIDQIADEALKEINTRFGGGYSFMSSHESNK